LARGGHVIYSGASGNMLEYFGGHGHTGNGNPADFVLNLSSVDQRNIEVETETRRRVDFLKSQWLDHAEKSASWN
jgi:hypothetical protein